MQADRKEYSIMTSAATHGIKYTCTSCATRFYDLNKQPAVCPKCAQTVVVLVKAPRRARRKAGDSLSSESNVLTTVIAPKVKSKNVKWK